MEYRVTKYNPKNRNEKGNYLISDEWTEFGDVGNSVSLEEYELVETAYIETALAMLEETKCAGLYIVGFEEHLVNAPYQNGDFVPLSDLGEQFRSVLRYKFGCKFENNSHFVHFGYDFYMYVGTSQKCTKAIEFAESKGLYVEEYKSPYK